MSEKLTLRECRVDEAAQVCEIILAAFEEYRLTLVPASGAHNETPKSIAEKMGKGGAFAIYEADGRMVACTLYRWDDGFLYFSRLSVLPEYRRQGLARRLIQAVERHCASQGVRAIQLGVRLGLESNLNLYQGLGYQIIAYEMHEGYDEPTWVTMEKRLL